jgi:hypothetical protein
MRRNSTAPAWTRRRDPEQEVTRKELEVFSIDRLAKEDPEGCFRRSLGDDGDDGGTPPEAA